MNISKSIIAGITFFIASSTVAFAGYQMNAIKVVNGDRGGVITIQKHADGIRNQYRNIKGTLTASDIHTELEYPSNNTTLNVVVSGRVAFTGERLFQESGLLVLNGKFRILHPAAYRLVLKDITISGIEENHTISGTISFNDVDYEFADSPDSLKRFVHRLIWWIRY